MGFEFIHSLRTTADFRFQRMESLDIAPSLPPVPAEVEGPAGIFVKRKTQTIRQEVITDGLGLFYFG